MINVILEFIYSNNKTKIKHRKNKFFFNEELFNAKHKFYYKYPYCLKGSINDKINYCINFLPLEENKTRLYINIVDNNNSDIDTKIFINYILKNKLTNLKNYDNNNYLKYLIMLKDDNSYMKKFIYYLINIHFQMILQFLVFINIDNFIDIRIIFNILKSFFYK